MPVFKMLKSLSISIDQSHEVRPNLVVSYDSNKLYGSEAARFFTLTEKKGEKSGNFHRLCNI